MVNRLREIRQKLQLTQQAMAQYLGIGKSAMSMIETGKAALSERNKNILVKNLNINPQWLNTGEGEMFNSNKNNLSKTHDGAMLTSNVPLYNIGKNFGLQRVLQKAKKITPVDYIYVPKLSKCDGAVAILGDSMYPQIKSGDIVIYKTMDSIDDVFWGEMYLLSIDVQGQEYATIKILQKSNNEDSVILLSGNAQYQDKEIEKSKIRALAMVKASINFR
ncbi:MAG: LexA family transcriptional regulator [Rikenellaceae bacterium]